MKLLSDHPIKSRHTSGSNKHRCDNNIYITCNRLYYTLLYSTLLYYNIIYYTVLHYTILYYNILLD